MVRETLAAFTSLAPGQDRAAHHNVCIASWQSAGAEIFSFNHPSEIAALRSLYEVNFVPVWETSAPLFGQHYIPISAMLSHAGARRGPVLIINADIELQATPWELKRIRWLCEGALCYFVRYNYDCDIRLAVKETYGIDAFLLNGREANLFPRSFLSMGQPFWDYWIPFTFASMGGRIYTVEAPLLFHKSHPRRWSDSAWHRSALEFDRLSGLLGSDKSMDACVRMSADVRGVFDARKHVVPARPTPIRDWIEKRFSVSGPKIFFELGAHDGTDTAWMAALPDVTIHAFEPDPRNHPPPLAKVVLTRAAVSDRDGRAPFILSQTCWGRPWTHSSSLKQPKNHLSRYPVTFGETTEVDSVTLDSYARAHGIDFVDLIWADIQGAEGEMIRGARHVLRRTRYIYTEYSDDELYAGQATLDDICGLLPDFRMLELRSDDVLLENRNMS
jgi:2-O-methyltransferase